jgi:hypothetical protein
MLQAVETKTIATERTPEAVEFADLAAKAQGGY